MEQINSKIVEQIYILIYLCDQTLAIDYAAEFEFLYAQILIAGSRKVGIVNLYVRMGPSIHSQIGRVCVWYRVLISGWP